MPDERKQPKDLRVRVERFLAGERNLEDLHRLFGYFRFRTGGAAPALKDIGDFQAHKDSRDQGISWKRGRNYLELFIHLHYFAGGAGLVTTGQHFKKVLLAGLDAFGPAYVKTNLGFSEKKAKKLVISGSSKIDFVKNGRVHYIGPVTRD